MLGKSKAPPQRVFTVVADAGGELTICSFLELSDVEQRKDLIKELESRGWKMKFLIGGEEVSAF